MDDLRWIIEGALEIDPSLLEASEGARACDIPTVASLPKLDAAKAFLGRGSSPANPTNTNSPHPTMRLNCCRAPKRLDRSFIDSRGVIHRLQAWTSLRLTSRPRMRRPTCRRRRKQQASRKSTTGVGDFSSRMVAVEREEGQDRGALSLYPPVRA